MDLGQMMGGMSNMPMGNFNPAMLQKVGQAMTMFQKGQDVKTVIGTLKSQGLTPQSAEQMLYVVFPQLRQVKQQMENSGLSPQEFLKHTAQKNNMTDQELNKMLGGLMNNN